MIKINTNHIGDMPMPFSGTESSGILELSADDGPVPKGEIHYNLLGTLTGTDLLVTGSLSVTLEAVCGRCLEPFRTELSVGNVCHLFEGVQGQEVDLTQDLREDILLAMPVVFRCSPSCKGLCPGCGANLNQGKCRCRKEKKAKGKTTPEGPSPWDALSGLNFKK